MPVEETINHGWIHAGTDPVDRIKGAYAAQSGERGIAGGEDGALQIEVHAPEGCEVEVVS